MSTRESTQLSIRPHIIELGVGQPDPSLLPREAIRRASETLLESSSDWAPLAYGANAGPETLLEELARRMAAGEREPDPDQLLISGGNSQALDELCALLGKPGDAVLVESPTYNFALQILRDHDLQVVPVEMDGAGLVPDSVDETVRTLRRKGLHPAFLYTIPTFHNPTGVSLAPDRRQQLLTVAANHDLWIVEDDVYRDLSYVGPAPPSLWELDDSQSVVRLGTFSKILAPGLRVGWITAPSVLASKLTDGGLRMSGGGVSHFSAMTVGEFMAAGKLEPHLDELRATYRSRRDGLSVALTELLPDTEHTVPDGGYFIWLKLPSLIDAQGLLSAAEQAGVSYVPGHIFCSNGEGRDRIRLSFSMYSREQLRDGVAFLSAALATM